MLLEFKTENYRSFKDGFEFSMIPDNAKKDLKYSILKEVINKKKYYGLCSSIVYGPNASGKSNIIEAMHTLKSIIKNGHVNNSNQPQNWSTTPNPAAFRLDLIPNNMLKKPSPIGFDITFTTKYFLVRYNLRIDLGGFLEQDSTHKILSEKLFIDENLIFFRKPGKAYLNIEIFKKYSEYINVEYSDSGNSIAQKTLKDDELFLINGFKNIFAPKLTEIITNWFDSQLSIIHHAETFQISPVINNQKAATLPLYIKEIAKSIGLASNDMLYIKSEENSVPQLFSVFEKYNTGVVAEAIESYGTIRLINLLLPLVQTFIDGTTLVIDEFDCSLHPMVVMSIINLFHNPDINKNNAQLIFNTHNPIFLNKDLFRRDEIKFVDRGEDQFSELYSLADFPTSGKGSVRSTTEYMKNYFISRYGAIKDIDFTPIFEKIMNDKNFILEKIEK